MTAVKGKIQTLGELVSRALLSTKLGSQYGGDRNVYTALGYPTDIEFEDYYARYSRQDIAKAVINRPVSYTWKGDVLITEVGDDEDTELEKAWRLMLKEFQLKSKFVRLDKLSSIGQYGILLLGLSDVKRPADFQKPVVLSSNLELLYLKPLAEGNAAVNQYVKNTQDPRYGLIENYNVKLTNPGTKVTTDLIVHHSRVIHVTSELLESETDGEPVMKALWNRLMDLEKLVGGSAEMFWRGARPGYQGIVDPEYQAPDSLDDELLAQLDEFEHNLRRIIMNQGVEMKALTPQVADPSKHVDIQIQMISALTGIPKRILTGSERGELASEQDLTGWYSVIQTRREEHAEENIIRPFVDRMIEYGILPPPIGEEGEGDYQIQWQDLFAASDKEQAEVGRIRSEALSKYASSPAAEMIVPPDAFLEYFMGLNEDERERIQQLVDAAYEEEQRLIAEGKIPDPMNPTPDEEEEEEEEEIVE